MSEPITLIRADDPERKPLLYACPKCGTAHSPRIYLAPPEVAHEAARNAAADCWHCREHNTCSECGARCPKGRTKCEGCSWAAKLAKATKVPFDEIGPCFSADGERFFFDPAEAIEAGEQWVFGTMFRPFRLHPDDVLTMILDDHHEDASTHDLVGGDALLAAINAFNNAQTSGSYDIDYSRVAEVPKP